MWSYQTREGTFYIKRDAGGFAPWFGEEHLGWYATAQQALEDLVGGHTFTPSCGDPSRLGLPDDLSEWDFRG
jgi:hypothetical protein